MAAIVGGAAVISFPALIAAGLSPSCRGGQHHSRLPPACSSPPSPTFQLPPFDRSFIAMALASIVGAVRRRAAGDDARTIIFGAGAAAARLRHAAVCFAGRISTWLTARAAKHRGNATPLHRHQHADGAAGLVYGGYFGAGVGSLSSAFSLGTAGDYRSANVTKNLVSA